MGAVLFLASEQGSFITGRTLSRADGGEFRDRSSLALRPEHPEAFELGRAGLPFVQRHE